MFIDSFASFIGYWASHTQWVVSLVLLGYFFVDAKMCLKVLLLFLFVMVYNGYLKSIWQCPLPPAIAHFNTWSYPSGHMHSAMILWGYLALQTRHYIVVALTALVLSFAAYYIVDAGYHYLRDIIGAVFFAAISLAVFSKMDRVQKLNAMPYKHGYWLLILSILCLMLTPSDALREPMFKGLGGLVGLTLGGWYTLSKPPVKKPYWWLGVLLIPTIAWLILNLDQYIILKVSDFKFVTIKYALFAFWISASKRIFGIHLERLEGALKSRIKRSLGLPAVR